MTVLKTQDTEPTDNERTNATLLPSTIHVFGICKVGTPPVDEDGLPCCADDDDEGEGEAPLFFPLSLRPFEEVTLPNFTPGRGEAAETAIEGLR